MMAGGETGQHSLANPLYGLADVSVSSPYATASEPSSHTAAGQAKQFPTYAAVSGWRGADPFSPRTGSEYLDCMPHPAPDDTEYLDCVPTPTAGLAVPMEGAYSQPTGPAVSEEGAYSQPTGPVMSEEGAYSQPTDPQSDISSPVDDFLHDMEV